MFLANKMLIFLEVSISFVIQNLLTSAFGGHGSSLWRRLLVLADD
jgi:hypothetical protein